MRPSGRVEPRIVSLLPGATEILFALGLGGSVVGVSHACDFPPEARSRPSVTRPLVDTSGKSSREIDDAVRKAEHEGHPLYAIDETALARLEPTHVVTQGLCRVCAVDADDVRAVASRFEAAAEIIELSPRSLADILGDVRRLGTIFGVEDRADRWLGEAIGRLEAVAGVVERAIRPRVACLEWLSPLMTAGHWVPEMVEIAGGEEVLEKAGEKSRRVSWEEVAAAGPDVLILMPCGFDVRGTLERLGELRLPGGLLGVASFAVDGNAYFSRPGPRFVEGVELLVSVFHPELRDWRGPADAWAPVQAPASPPPG